jgi:hypothetical protein
MRSELKTLEATTPIFSNLKAIIEIPYTQQFAPDLIHSLEYNYSLFYYIVLLEKQLTGEV